MTIRCEAFKGLSSHANGSLSEIDHRKHEMQRNPTKCSRVLRAVLRMWLVSYDVSCELTERAGGCDSGSWGRAMARMNRGQASGLRAAPHMNMG